MRTIIALCGFGSMVGMLIANVVAVLAMIWDVEFLVKLGFSAFVVFIALFIAAIVSSNSPFYED